MCFFKSLYFLTHPRIQAYACDTWEFAADTYLFEIVAPAKQCSAHHWYLSTAHTDP